jgi:hypothetical protein
MTNTTEIPHVVRARRADGPWIVLERFATAPAAMLAAVMLAHDADAAGLFLDVVPDDDSMT